MKIYPLTEGDLHHISLMNTYSLAAFSIGSLAVGIGLEIFVNAAFSSGEVSATAAILSDRVAPAAFAFAALLYLVGIVTLIKRRSLLKAVQDESKAV